MAESTTTTSARHLDGAATLRARATSLREQAGSLDEVLSLTYRRRASELELEAFLLDAQAGVEAPEVHSAA
ncbi:MAG: hypothetical protein MUE36_10100 [Acidimicrobiales bacterium]|jgi:hypothetical protein|nr:hypothetical protein [Acidimicrobiales bacterium]